MGADPTRVRSDPIAIPLSRPMPPQAPLPPLAYGRGPASVDACIDEIIAIELRRVDCSQRARPIDASDVC